MKSNKVEEKTKAVSSSSSNNNVKKCSVNNENEEDENDEFYDSESEPSFIDASSPDDEKFASPNPQKQQQQTPVSLKREQQPQQSQQTITYYAVQFSTDESAKKAASTSNGNNSRIFCNKENAMKLCKLDPENRTFKVFTSFKEAYTFSFGTINSSDELNQTQTLSSYEQAAASLQSEANNGSPLTSSRLSLAQEAEKLPFPAPRKPEVNEMRAFIEKNLFEKFRDKVVANPRFLISSGDAPIVYQEACRYNCLHVCAKENRPQICQLILSLLSSVAYVNKLYKNDSVEQARERSKHYLDLYLNTPEKGLNETPLHFAAKFGSYEVARMFLASDMCQKMPVNKYGQTPKDVICTKVTAKATKQQIDQMSSLFEECYYVPVYRDEERGDVLVDRPSPKFSTIIMTPPLAPSSSNLDDANTNTNSSSLLLASPLSRSSSFTTSNAAEQQRSSPLTPIRLNGSAVFTSQSQKKLAAYVGPISTSAAEKIYEKIKSPAGLRKSPANINILRGDDYKGYERILREITSQMNVPFSEYWAFLDKFCNLKTREGLETLEIYLRQKRLLTVLESQLKSAQVIRNDRLNNNGGLSIFSSSLSSNNELLLKLDEFIELTANDLIASRLELKENQLSHRYEQFAKLAIDSSSKSNLLSLLDTMRINLSSNKTDELLAIDDLITREDFYIYDSLARYMTAIIELCKLDKTSKCYFNLYKTSKEVLALLNCEKPFDSFYLSPVFKRFSLQKSLIRPSINNSPFQMRTNTKINFDSDEEEEEKEEDNSLLSSSSSEEEDESESSDGEKMYDAEDASPIIDDLNRHNNNAAKKIVTSPTEELSRELNALSLKSSSPCRESNDEDDYKLNPIDNKQPITKSQQPSGNEDDNKYRLFMFGEIPSKLDRAVYLAIQGVRLDSSAYPFLSRWYSYMKAKQSDMQSWKTPTKKLTTKQFEI